MNKSFFKKDLVKYALVICIYVVSNFIFSNSIIRLGESLSSLICINYMYMWPITLGCLITNILSGNIVDMVFGTLATLIGLIISINIKHKNYFIKMTPYVLINAICVPFIYIYGYGFKLPYVYYWSYIFVSEGLTVWILGYIIKNMYEKYKF